MSDQSLQRETLAQNTAILANAVELGSQIVSQIAGTDAVGNTYDGKTVTTETIQSGIEAEVRKSLQPYLGG